MNSEKQIKLLGETIVAAIQASNADNKTGNDGNGEKKDSRGIMGEYLIRTLLGFVSIAVVGIFSAVIELQQGMVELKTNQKFAFDSSKKFESFMEKPRFTFEDYKASNLPWEQRVIRNEAALSDRQDWMSTMNNRVSRVENNYNNILEKFQGLEFLLKDAIMRQDNINNKNNGE